MAETQTEVKPLVVNTHMRAYKLKYRHRNRIGGGAQGDVKEKCFWFPGNQKEAIEEARRHCTTMEYTFIYCLPFIVDLKAQEDSKKKGLIVEGEE
jgi:hypothetical protein